MTINSNRRITILGSTGSIGTNSLDVLKDKREQFKVQYLTTNVNWQLLFEQAREFSPVAVAIAGVDATREVEKKFASIGVKTYWGVDGLLEIAKMGDTDLVINALVGAVGLQPTLLAMDAGKNIALSNKETLVVAGELVMEKAAKLGLKIVPIDSEHSAIYQCLLGEPYDNIRRLIITASGGPFWNRSRESFKNITVAEALKHPNWNMGRKITIDSATLMNKGLEVIEARWLFNLPPEKISVIVHPPSIVHSMVEFVDGALKAQLGIPDMRIPIQYALSYPERWDCPAVPFMDLSQKFSLEFFPPDFDKFITLKLAFSALETGGTAPAVLNAANEAAVALFLAEKIEFNEIFKVLDNALSTYAHISRPDLEQLLEADAWGRRFVKQNFGN